MMVGFMFLYKSNNVLKLRNC